MVMQSGFPIDLILFGMIAAFLVLRLRSVLGRRTGFERSQQSRTRPGQPSGRVIDVPPDPPEPAGRPLPDAASPPGQAMQRMQRVDRDFSAARFLEGAEAAFRLIVAAFAAGDRVQLRSLLNDETYRAFETAIAQREAAGQTQRTELRGIGSATIEAAALAGTLADITVRFVSDQVSLTTDGTGNPVSGTESVTEIVDVWTFQRDLAASDPAWRLCRTA
jgi:predicted lipid-binding transport protein (Tim44 family)